jgi:hypothetical protein
VDERQRLVEQLDEAHEKLRAVLVGIDPTMAMSPTWTVKEIIGHIAGWDDATIEMLRAHVTGDPLDAPQWVTIDHYNARSVETRRPLTYEQTVGEWEQTRTQLKAMIEDMPADKVPEPMEFLWGQSGTVAQLVAIMAHHEADHATKVEQQKSIPPEVR